MLHAFYRPGIGSPDALPLDVIRHARSRVCLVAVCSRPIHGAAADHISLLQQAIVHPAAVCLHFADVVRMCWTPQRGDCCDGGPPCCRSSILSGSRTSRLYRALVQPGRATSASAVSGYPGEKYPGAALFARPACMHFISVRLADLRYAAITSRAKLPAHR